MLVLKMVDLVLRRMDFKLKVWILCSNNDGFCADNTGRSGYLVRTPATSATLCYARVPLSADGLLAFRMARLKSSGGLGGGAVEEPSSAHAPADGSASTGHSAKAASAASNPFQRGVPGSGASPSTDEDARPGDMTSVTKERAKKPAGRRPPSKVGRTSSRDSASSADDAGAPEAADGGAFVALQAELEQLKMPELRKRAAEAGVSDDAIEEARDGEQPKVDVITLIVDAAAAVAAAELEQGGGSNAEAEVEAALREELGSLKLKALKMRAREVGVGDGDLDDADDADDVKQAVVELIIAAATPAAADGNPEEAEQETPGALQKRVIVALKAATACGKAQKDSANASGSDEKLRLSAEAAASYTTAIDLNALLQGRSDAKQQVKEALAPKYVYATHLVHQSPACIYKGLLWDQG